MPSAAQHRTYQMPSPYQMPSYLSGTCSATSYTRGCSASSGECTGKAQNQPPAFSPLGW
jgi:hypothetical protein